MEGNEVLVKVEGLSKKFCKDLKMSLWYGVKDLFSNLRGNKEDRHLREQEFWAVKDINFELRRGECLGLIGHNGAGKSTLLKILNGLIKPDEGKVIVRGRVGALIELGAGFNPILTGKENIFNNGAVLGFTKKEIKDKLEEIIDFAEIREFIDMPVQNYSSGMKVRLGFAVAAQMEPDVLIIDEVLAVGDLGFMLKCFKKIDELLPKTAIVFVSHSMPQVSRLCNQVILLDRGNANFQGKEVPRAIDLYYSRFSNNETKTISDDGSLQLKKAELLDVVDKKSDLYQILWKGNLKLHLIFKVEKNIQIPRFSIEIFDKEQRPVALLEENSSDADIKVVKNTINLIIEHRELQLSKGIYSINLHVSLGRLGGPLLRINNILQFQVLHENDIWHPFLLSSNYITTLPPNEKLQ